MEQVECPYDDISWSDYERFIFNQGSLKQLEADEKKYKELGEHTTHLIDDVIRLEAKVKRLAGTRR